jgi:hypothetical protein
MEGVVTVKAVTALAHSHTDQQIRVAAPSYKEIKQQHLQL